MTSSTPSTNFEYAAFISYRHRDNAEAGRQWATWLHTSLEQYKVPRDLVGTTGAWGHPVPANLFPVFRDEEELSADHNLSETLRRALDRSRILIVLCSPRAVASRFVDKEIRYFKELGRSDSIIALLLDGEPNVLDDSGRPREGFTAEMECLPHALRFGVPRADGTIDWDAPAAEPIAADARPGGRPEQGWTSSAAHRLALAREGLPRPEISKRAREYEKELQTALLKIVARALGINLRELTRRDQAYQLIQARQRARNLARLSVAFAVLTLLALGGGLFAWKKQRDEALQRSTAEELLSFMLFDLRDKLEPIGRSYLLTSVADSAKRYFDKFPEDSSNTTSQRQRAALVSNIGDIRLDQSNLPEAEASFQAALLARRRLLSLNAKDVEARQEVWSTLNRLSKVRLKQRRLGEAEAYMREALALARDLAADTKQEAGLVNTAITLDGLAGILQLEGRTDEAQAVYLEAFQLRQRRMELEPGNVEALRGITIAQHHLGDIALAKNDLPEATKYYEAARRIREKLAAGDDSTARARMELSSSLNKLASVEQKAGNLAAAEKSYRQSLDIRRRLAEDDPFSASARSQLSTCYHRLGDVLAAQQRPTEAAAALREALQIRQSLADLDPTDADAKRVLCYTLDSLGKALAAEGTHESLLEAERSHRLSLSITKALAEADLKSADSRLNLAVSYNRVSAIEVRLGRLADAEKSLSESIKITARLAAEDAANADMQSYYCQDLESLIELQLKMGRFEDGAQTFAQVHQQRQRLAASATAGDSTHRDLALCRKLNARLMLAKNDPQQALASYSTSREILARLFQKRPADATAWKDYATILDDMAGLAEKQRSWPQALAWRQESLAALSRAREAKNPRFRGDLAKKETILAHRNLVFALIVSRDFPEALKIAQAAIAEFQALEAEAMMAHAFLFNGRWDEAREIYLRHSEGEPRVPSREWQGLIEADFKRFKAAETVHPDLAKAEEALRLTAAGN